MKILAIEREVQGTRSEQFEAHLIQEAAQVWELYQTGIIRELYFRQDQSSAVLMLECEDIKAADQVINTLPLVKERLITFDLIPLKAYSGFSRLFTEA